VDFTLKPPSSLGPGYYTDTFGISVCFDTACTKPAAGSPFTANITYIVDPTEGTNYVQNTIGISVAGMVWDSQTQKIYGIVPGYSAVDGNTLAQMDPFTASIDTTVSLDGGTGKIEPGTLAVSDDGQYLYVAVSDAAQQTDHVERIRTADLGLDLSISLPAQSLVAALQEGPASPQTLAVAVYEPSSELFIYDNATPRSNALSAGTNTQVEAFAWGADTSTLYAYLSTTGTGTLEAASVSASGLSVSQSSSSAALFNELLGNMHFVNGLLYFDSGGVFDPSSFTLGTPFTVYGSSEAGGGGAFDSQLNRAYLMAEDDQPANTTGNIMTIEGFNLSTQALLWLLHVPAQNVPGNLIRWGSNGLAFFNNTGSGSLELLSGAIVTQ
jgi:hypothetical protein